MCMCMCICMCVYVLTGSRKEVVKQVWGQEADVAPELVIEDKCSNSRRFILTPPSRRPISGH